MKDALTRSVRQLCLAFPETSEGTQFGHPVWLAGKKAFVLAKSHDDRWWVNFWVGVHTQLLMTEDRRYTIPAYMACIG